VALVLAMLNLLLPLRSGGEDDGYIEELYMLHHSVARHNFAGRRITR
jgi:hypothetical protein